MQNTEGWGVVQLEGRQIGNWGGRKPRGKSRQKCGAGGVGGGGGSVFCASLFPGLRLNFYGHMILNASGWASWKTQILDLRSLSPKRTVAQEFLGLMRGWLPGMKQMTSALRGCLIGKGRLSRPLPGASY